MDRKYDFLLREHVAENRQIAMLTGPRQVGKTTCSRSVDRDGVYMNWDDPADRKTILSGPDSIAMRVELDRLRASHPLLILDEVHKFRKWKSLLKGFHDLHGEKIRTIITGSARMNVYKRGGDSLMGRYFLYRMHPLSVRELAAPSLNDNESVSPVKISGDDFLCLLEYGGFPEPYLKADRRFYNRWRRLRTEQLFHEDIRDLTMISEIAQIELLGELIRGQSGGLMNMSSLASAIQVTVDSVRRWMAILDSMYYCFFVRPWFVNVPKTIRKQPKVYLRDWSLVSNSGARIETFVAAHLLKAVHFWTDYGIGEFSLHFLRDKEKRKVDFLVARNKKPFFIAEVKSSANAAISPALAYFQKKLDVPHAFQIVFDMEYVDRDCFEEKGPIRVPALTFLSQLV